MYRTGPDEIVFFGFKTGPDDFCPVSGIYRIYRIRLPEINDPVRSFQKHIYKYKNQYKNSEIIKVGIRNYSILR